MYTAKEQLSTNPNLGGITVKKHLLMVSGNKSCTCQSCYLKFMQELPFHSASLNSSQAENLNLSAVSEVSDRPGQGG